MFSSIDNWQKVEPAIQSGATGANLTMFSKQTRLGGATLQALVLPQPPATPNHVSRLNRSCDRAKELQRASLHELVCYSVETAQFAQCTHPLLVSTDSLGEKPLLCFHAARSSVLAHMLTAVCLLADKQDRHDGLDATKS